MNGELSYEARARGALGREDFRFSHRLGQNFILDDAVVDEIAARSGAEKGDVVLEIGPGAGTLTAALRRRGAYVLAVEVDTGLKPVLTSLLGGDEGVRLRFGDILKCDLNELRAEMLAMGGGGRLLVAANLPYYITSDVLTRFARSGARFDALTVMVQQEAAERMMARRGSKQYCLLSALLGWEYALEEVMRLPRTLFTPAPHVDSALVRLEPHAQPPAEVRERAMLLRTLSAAFLMRRKTMLNNLCAAFSLSREEAAAALDEAGLAPNVRGEALDYAQLAALANALSARRGDIGTTV